MLRQFYILVKLLVVVRHTLLLINSLNETMIIPRSALQVGLSAGSLSRIFLGIEQPTYHTEHHFFKPPLSTIRTGATAFDKSSWSTVQLGPPRDSGLPHSELSTGAGHVNKRLSRTKTFPRVFRSCHSMAGGKRRHAKSCRTRSSVSVYQASILQSLSVMYSKT